MKCRLDINEILARIMDNDYYFHKVIIYIENFSLIQCDSSVKRSKHHMNAFALLYRLVHFVWKQISMI